MGAGWCSVKCSEDDTSGAGPSHTVACRSPKPPGPGSSPVQEDSGKEVILDAEATGSGPTSFSGRHEAI
jgi:hypothetical protein